MMAQYQDLADTCSQVARERDKARAEVQLLREELHRYMYYATNIDDHHHVIFFSIQDMNLIPMGCPPVVTH